MSLVIYDKNGNTIPIKYKLGQSLYEILKINGIPISNVILKIDEKIIPIETALYEVVTNRTNFKIRIVENYILQEVISPPIIITQKVDKPYYVERILRTHKRSIFIEEYQYDKQSFIQYVETKFIKNIKENKLIEDGDIIVLGFSGGTDSTFILHMLKKIKEHLPKFELIAATITDLPDVNIEYANKYCKENKIRHIIIDSNIIKKIFNLRAPFIEIIRALSDSPHAEQALYIGHHIIRRGLEIAAEQNNSNKIILGLEKEEFLPAILGTMTTGVPILGVEKRVGPQFTYIFPNYTISKREVLLYLDAELPDYHVPGPYQQITLGGFSPTRALYFYLAGHMYEVWPGMEHHFFSGYRDIRHKMKDSFSFAVCNQCGGAFLMDTRSSFQQEVCMACQVLKDAGWTT